MNIEYTSLPKGCTLLNNNLIGIDMSFYTFYSVQEELMLLIHIWREENNCYYVPKQ